MDTVKHQKKQKNDGENNNDDEITAARDRKVSDISPGESSAGEGISTKT